MIGGLVERIGRWLQRRLGHEAAFGAGLQYEAKRDFENAVEAYAQAEDVCLTKEGATGPQLPAYAAKLAHCLVLAGRYSEAVTAYERALGYRRRHASLSVRPSEEAILEGLADARRRSRGE